LFASLSSLKIHKKASRDERPESSAIKLPETNASLLRFFVPLRGSEFEWPQKSSKFTKKSVERPEFRVESDQNSRPESLFFCVFSCLFAAQNLNGHKKAQNSQKKRRETSVQSRAPCHVSAFRFPLFSFFYSVLWNPTSVLGCTAADLRLFLPFCGYAFVWPQKGSKFTK
jgi:hypothetical protein